MVHWHKDVTLAGNDGSQSWAPMVKDESSMDTNNVKLVESNSLDTKGVDEDDSTVQIVLLVCRAEKASH